MYKMINKLARLFLLCVVAGQTQAKTDKLNDVLIFGGDVSNY